MPEIQALAECADVERVVRALVNQLYDPENATVDPEAFEKNSPVSVSRLEIYTIEKILAVFENQLHSPPRINLKGGAIVGVGVLKALGRNLMVAEGGKVRNRPVEIKVKESPTPENLSHADIHPKISRTLARDIVRKGGLEIVPFAPNPPPTAG